jgi:phage terminase small subunit
MERDEMRHQCGADDRPDDRPGAGNRFQAGATRADAPTVAVDDGVESVTRPKSPQADPTGQDGGGRQQLRGGAETGIGYQAEGEPTRLEQQSPDRANMPTSRCGRKAGKKVSQPPGPEEPGEGTRNTEKDNELGEGGNKAERGKNGKSGEKRPRASTHRPADVLSERERRFVDAFVGPAQGNAREAARLAGYKHHPRAAELMKRERVRAEVSKRTRAKGLSSDVVLSRVAAIATADMADFAPLIGCRSTATAKRVLAQLQAEGKTLAIRRLVPSRWGLGVELYPADAALALAGKHLGLFRDQVEVTVNTAQIDGVAQRRLLSDPQACDLAATLDARLALPAPEAQKGPGLPSEEPVDVEWSNLPGEPDKPS